jgi:nitrate reductase gamma subunit
MATVLFVVFPYLAVILAIGVGMYRWYTRRFTYSSLSSQLLENRALFWGSVPWHYGISLVLLAHLLVWLLPPVALAILGHGTRLFVFEAIGVVLTLFALFGVVLLIWRRLSTRSRAHAVTSPMDGILLFLLLLQTVTGAVVALFDRWGSLWYLSAVVPWLWSLVRLQPDITSVVALPAFIQFHIVCGFVIILLFPFSRLVHLIVPPIHYLFRPYQLVIWNRQPRRALPAAAAPPRPSEGGPL